MSNKVSSKNPKNENFEIYEGKVHSLLAKAASNLFKDKYFHEEFKGVFLFSVALKIVSSMISFCTGVLAVHLATRLFFGYYPSFFFAVAVGFCIEGIKTFLWRINSKWTLKYKEVSKGIVFVLVSLHGVSFAFSAYGGWMIPTFIDEIKTETPVLVQNDSALTALYSSLGEINAQIEINSGEVAKTTSNRTKRDLSANVSLLLEQRNFKENEISQIKENQRLENEAAEQEQLAKTQALIVEQQNEISMARISCLIASIFFELLFIVCACFGVYYLFRFEIDQTAESQEPGSLTESKESGFNSDNLPSRQQPEKAPELLEGKTVSKPNQIGFVSNTRHDSKKTALERKEVSCHDSKTDSKTDSKICALDGCSNRWKGGQHNKKYCGDSCRKLDHQIRVYKNQLSVKKSKSQKS